MSGVTQQKIEKVMHSSEPSNLKELQSFLGFINYYQQLVPGYSSSIAPLLKLTKKGTPYYWDDHCRQVFQWLKEYFTKPPQLSYPMADGGIFIVDTDASDQGIGAVLSQEQDGEEKIIAYASSTLSHSREGTAQPTKSCLLLFIL